MMFGILELGSKSEFFTQAQKTNDMSLKNKVLEKS